MGQYGIGQGIKRVEDVRLLRGAGRYLDDVNVPGQAHAVIVRSQHAHARLRAVDTKAAMAAPGVLAVFTGTDVSGLGTMTMTLKRKRPDGSPMFAGLITASPRTACATWATRSRSSSPRRAPRPRTRPTWSRSITSPCPR
jgi:CO/xanthine dehydrogenase Mo-binding subunit